MTAERPVAALIGALGGQGGGVLVDWLVTAAEKSGYPAQATSTPGVAQRTGATTYLFELFPEKNPSQPPLFALFPGSDDIDLMAALEPTEAGRALERGFVTDRTTVITATERTYSTAEKVAAGDGTVPARPVLDGLSQASKDLIALPMMELTGGVSPQWNAVLFGAIAGSGVFPFSVDNCRDAIRGKGVAVDQNLKGFEQGVEQARIKAPLPEEEDGLAYNGPPPGFETELDQYPERLRPIIGHALARLVDYQDDAYARLFLEHLQTVNARDTSDNMTLTEEVAKRLAAWMSFEDVIRVAQLKTRPGRLDRIRGELKLPDDAILNLRDYFKPGHAEMAGFLPSWLAWMVPRGSGRAGSGWSLHWPTSSAWGFAGLKLLAGRKGFRRAGSQYNEEHAAIGRWLDAIRAAAPVDMELAIQTAKAAIWARGYGMVRKEGMAALDQLLDGWTEKLSDPAALKAAVDQSIILAHANPDADIH